jgi:hypothetical protein
VIPDAGFFHATLQVWAAALACGLPAVPEAAPWPPAAAEDGPRRSTSNRQRGARSGWARRRLANGA